MKISDIMQKININKVMNVIALNEISGNENFIYKFSLAGGKSGYSFGCSQFDVSNNAEARIFLREKCGFSFDEVERLKKLDKNIDDLQEKLSRFKIEIDKLDLQHTKDMINYVSSLEKLPDLENEKTFIHLIDYHNQFNLSRNGKLHSFLKNQNFATSEMILKFKLEQTKWGIEHPEDVKRRFFNIEKTWGTI